MKKKSGILIALLLFVSVLGLISSVRGGSAHFVYVEEFATDKTLYYPTDDIKINLTWSNFYIPPDYQVVRVEIRNSSDYMLWDSGWNDTITGEPPDYLVEGWEIPVQSITDKPEALQVRVCGYYTDFAIYDDYFIIDVINIEIVKKNVSCQVTGFQDNLDYGVNYNFSATFTDFESFPLINQLICVEHVSNSYYSLKNDITNELGVINVSLVTNETGTHLVKLSIKDNPIYNDSVFMLYFNVEKISILHNLNGFSDIVYDEEDFEFGMYFYYVMNGTAYDLKDYYFDFEIYNGDEFLSKNVYRTNGVGIVSIIILKEVLGEYNSLRFEIGLNGTDVFEESNFELNITIMVGDSTHYVYVEEFAMGKTSHYPTDDIKINLTWSNFYIPPDYQAVRVEIRNSSDYMLWDSGWNDTIAGEPPYCLTEEWEFPVQSITDKPEALLVRVCGNYTDFAIYDDYFIIDVINIEIFKKNVSCQVTGFQDNLDYGVNCNFSATFTDFENISLINQLICVEHISNSYYSLKNDITNELGVINVSLVANETGTHLVKLFIKDNPIYNDSVFMFYFNVEKFSILHNLNGFSDIVYDDKDFEFGMYFYYVMNGTAYDLKDYYFDFEIYNGDEFLSKNVYRTNDVGIVNIIILKEVLGEYNSLRFEIGLNGTDVLEESDFELNIEVKEQSDTEEEGDDIKKDEKKSKEDEKKEEPLDLSVVYVIIFVGSIASVLSVTGFFVYKKRTAPKNLEDLTIKY